MSQNWQSRQRYFDCRSVSSVANSRVCSIQLTHNNVVTTTRLIDSTMWLVKLTFPRTIKYARTAQLSSMSQNRAVKRNGCAEVPRILRAAINKPDAMKPRAEIKSRCVAIGDFRE